MAARHMLPHHYAGHSPHCLLPAESRNFLAHPKDIEVHPRVSLACFKMFDELPPVPDRYVTIAFIIEQPRSPAL
ncbi:hypothetical protein [Sphingobium yanoikuyae]|uniref:hypothetical protein n=1 Tax=Sphingobium yanoikuyae TaxID=13690 RepID=UPI0012D32420|nr:hypothetical protein [Sphingobium yanoikuyae]